MTVRGNERDQPIFDETPRGLLRPLAVIAGEGRPVRAEEPAPLDERRQRPGVALYLTAPFRMCEHRHETRGRDVLGGLCDELELLGKVEPGAGKLAQHGARAFEDVVV